MLQRPDFLTPLQVIQDQSVYLGFEITCLSRRFQIYNRPKADGCTPEEEITYTFGILTLEVDFMTYEVRP